jgi:hypothetical protein
MAETFEYPPAFACNHPIVPKRNDSHLFIIKIRYHLCLTRLKLAMQRGAAIPSEVFLQGVESELVDVLCFTANNMH